MRHSNKSKKGEGNKNCSNQRGAKTEITFNQGFTLFRSTSLMTHSQADGRAFRPTVCNEEQGDQLWNLRIED